MRQNIFQLSELIFPFHDLFLKISEFTKMPMFSHSTRCIHNIKLLKILQQLLNEILQTCFTPACNSYFLMLLI